MLRSYRSAQASLPVSHPMADCNWRFCAVLTLGPRWGTYNAWDACRTLRDVDALIDGFGDVVRGGIVMAGERNPVAAAGGRVLAPMDRGVARGLALPVLHGPGGGCRFSPFRAGNIAADQVTQSNHCSLRQGFRLRPEALSVFHHCLRFTICCGPMTNP